MAKDSYLINMYNKINGISKSSFGAYLSNAEKQYYELEQSLIKVRDLVSSSNWRDSVNTSVDTSFDNINTLLNKCKNYNQDVIYPLSNEADVLMDRLKRYVEKVEHDSIFETITEGEKNDFYDDFFKNTREWINNYSKFRTDLLTYFTPKNGNTNNKAYQEYIINRVYSVIAQYKSYKINGSIYTDIDSGISYKVINGNLVKLQSNSGTIYISRMEQENMMLNKIMSQVKNVVETAYQPNFENYKRMKYGEEVSTASTEELADLCYESINKINTLLGNELIVKAVANISQNSENELFGNYSVLNNKTNNYTITGAYIGNSEVKSVSDSSIEIATASIGTAGAIGSAVSSDAGRGDSLTPLYVDNADSSEDQKNTDNGTRIHFIQNDTSDAILVESDGEFGLIDAANPSSGVFAQSTSNGTTVLNYLRSVGVSHLKFVMASHAHSDHIGGLPDIINSSLVDSTTTLIYKDVKRDSSIYGEIVLGADSNNETTLYNNIGEDWYSFTLLNNVKSAMQSKGGILLETINHNAAYMAALGATYVPSGDKWMDYITFKMGKLVFNIYNLPMYTQSENGKTYIDLNSNSLVTIVTSTTGKRIWLAGDLNARAEYEAYYGDRIGKVDIYKASHHGYLYSNSHALLSRLIPRYAVFPNSQGKAVGDCPPAYSYLKRMGTKTYFAGSSSIVFSIGNTIVPSREQELLSIPTKWYKWVDRDESTKWTYIENGNLSTGLKSIEGKSYYFGIDGIMETGWKEISGSWYFFDTTKGSALGAMKTGWLEDGGKWYYLNSDGKMRTSDWIEDKGEWYYLGSDGAMLVNDWVQDKGVWYYFNGTGAMVKNTTMTIDGKSYTFDSSGACQ